MNHWSKSDIEEWQNRQLQEFVRHAYDHTVYYRRLFDELGIRADDIRSSRDLAKLPVITKDIINAHYKELIPDNLPSFKYRLCRSGGTTGVPVQYNCDEDVWGYVTAAKLYYWKKAGYRFGDPFIAFGSASLFSRKPSLSRRIYDLIRNEHPLNCVDLTEGKCLQYCDYIKKKHIRFIYGYAAAIYILACFIKKNQIVIDGIKGVFTTSENLTDWYREVIEDAFHCKVMDCYGARDAGISAYESEPGCYCIGYNTLVEIGDAIGDGTGTVISTNFLNYSFPLLRYRFGDEAELCPAEEVKGYNGQQFKRLLGRSSHVLRLENGRSLSATGFSMIMKEFDISAFDISKSGENAVLLRIQTIPGKYTDKQEETITRTLRRYLGDDCKLTIEKVSQFETASNGKRTYFLV